MASNDVGVDDLPSPIQLSPAGKGDVSIDDLPSPPARGFWQTVDSYTVAPVRAAANAVQQDFHTPSRIVPDALNAAWNQLGTDPSDSPSFKDIAANAGLSTQAILPQFAQDRLAGMIKISPAGLAMNTLFPGTAENIASASPAGVAGVVGDVVGNPLNYLPVERVLGVAARGAGFMTDAAAGALDKFAGTQAAKAIGMRKADMLKLIEKYGPDAVSKMGNDAMDLDTVPLFGTPKNVATAADAAKESAGKELGNVIDASQATLDKMGPSGMMPSGEPVQATPVRPGMSYGKPQVQTVTAQPPATVAPDFSAIPPTVLKAPRPLPARIEQIMAAQEAAEVANLRTVNTKGYNPYDADVDVPVSRVNRTIDRAGPTESVLTPIAPRASGSMDAPALAQNIRGSGDMVALRKTPGMEGAAAQVDKFLDTLATNPQDMTLRDAQALRGRIDQSINYSKNVPEMAAAQQHLVTIRNAIGDAMSQAVDTAATRSGQDLGALKAANSKYNKAASISEFANDNLARQTANQAIGLTGKVAGAGGAAAGAVAGAPFGPAGVLVGEAAGGTSAAAAEKAARTLGPAFLANAGRGSANFIRGVPQFAQSAATTAARMLPSTSSFSLDGFSGSPIPKMAQGNPKQNRSPAGPDAWAQQGLSKLGINDPGVSKKLMSDPMAKNLLIHASGLQPGSLAMKNVIKQIQSRLGASQ